MSPVLAVVLGCVGWLVVSGYVLAFVQWMIGGDIDVLTGVIGLGIFIGMGVTMFRPPSPEVHYLCIAGIFGSGLVYPFLRGALHRKDQRATEIEGVRKAYEGFVFRPSNYPAMMKLARHLWNLGIRGHALTLAEAALPHLPAQYFREDHRLVQTWRAHPPAASEFEPIPCVECGEMNPPGVIHCGKCGARFLLHRVEGRSVSRSLGRRLLAVWLVMMMGIILVPMLRFLPPAGALAVICGVLALSGVLTILAFRPPQAEV